MTDVHSPPAVPPALVERVKRLIRTPSAEWEAIDAEPATVAGLFRSYVLYLAAIGPVAGLIGMVVFEHTPVIRACVLAAFGYGMSLVWVYVAGLVIDALAPRFGSFRDRLQAAKVAVYSPTPVMVCGVFDLIPALSFISVIGLVYSFYLLWVGLPKLMRTPPERRLGYYATFVLAMFGLGLLASMVLWPIMSV